jgi:formylglycine-generating enzyme required for sulfatase activity
MDPDHTALLNAFNDFIARYGQERESRLIFYFAGHGYTKRIYGNDIGYLLPVNCPNPERDPMGFQTRAMPMGQIELFAQQVQSKHALFLFDACFSGAVFAQSRDVPGIIGYKITKPVRQFITSGTADETVPDISIFRRQLVSGLNGDADLNHDGYITGTELGDFLQTTVVNYSKASLHPQFGKIRDPNLDKGDFVFVLGGKLSSADVSSPVALKNDTPVESISEKSLVRYGNIEITAGFAGKLYIDNVYKKDVSESTLITINNLTSGEHLVRIEGEDNVEKTVSVSPDMNVSVTLDRTIKSVAGMPEMVFVQGGTFQMGSNDGGFMEQPIHQVTVSDFYIGKYEVTQKQWRDVMGNNPSAFKDCIDCPVENVSWNDVQDFLKKLSQKTGVEFRLPTEAEWEYAARGGNQSLGYTYSGGQSLDNIAWFKGNNSSHKTNTVGQKQPNELKIFDMSGNVWEWCNDWCNEKYYISSPVIDPQGPSQGKTKSMRGGSFGEPEKNCRVTKRSFSWPDERAYFIGFRLCKTE